MAPRKLGPYQIHSELGRGAMAIVWRAHDGVLDRDVAIKEPLLPKGVDAATSAEFGTRFVREAKAAARLNHPGIVTIHAADIYDGHPAIVMELVEGETLGDMLERGALDKKLTMSILEQLLGAVGFAHDKGIVHRDIKPDNIFITPEGRVKLADFGIASLDSYSTLTQAGTVMGTPGYMAPEQVTGDPVDARADLFAVGVLAYEMITGKNPFGVSEGLPITTIMYRIVHQAPPEMEPEALEGLPEDVHAILGSALAKDPDSRFADAKSFLAALEGEGPIPAPGSTSAPESTAMANASSAGALATGGVATILSRLNGLKSATMINRGPTPQEPTWKRSWLPYAAVVAVGLIVMIALLASTGGGVGTVAATPDSSYLNTATTIRTTIGTTADPSKTVSDDGTYLVGTDIPAGIYKGEPTGSSAYWQISSDATGIDVIAREEVTAQFYLEVLDGQFLKLHSVTMSQ